MSVYREFGDILREKVIGGLSHVVPQSRDSMNYERPWGCLGEVPAQRPWG